MGPELVSVCVGKWSISRQLVEAGNLLDRHEYLRVEPHSGLRRGFAGFALCTLLDVVCVFRRGSTLVLYSDSGYPRPSSSLPEEERRKE